MKRISVDDVKGFRLGNAESSEKGTGCTVIICEEGAVGGVDVRGGGPATRETDLLRSENTVNAVNAVVLSGGSAFGLEADSGVMRELAERNIGFSVGDGLCVPIVCGASLYDLPMGDPKAFPDVEMGREAVRNAYEGVFSNGNHGAGTGATVGKIKGYERAMKTGIGTFACGDGFIEVGAIAAVNAVGDIYNGAGNIIAGLRSEDGSSIFGTIKTLKSMVHNSISHVDDNTAFISKADIEAALAAAAKQYKNETAAPAAETEQTEPEEAPAEHEQPEAITAETAEEIPETAEAVTAEEVPETSEVMITEEPSETAEIETAQTPVLEAGDYTEASETAADEVITEETAAAEITAKAISAEAEEPAETDDVKEEPVETASEAEAPADIAEEPEAPAETAEPEEAADEAVQESVPEVSPDNPENTYIEEVTEQAAEEAPEETEDDSADEPVVLTREEMGYDITFNTTISCLITNAVLTKSQANKLASILHDAYARAIKPVHGTLDGDTVFVLATGKQEVNFDAFAALATDVMQYAIIDGALSAEGAYGLPAARDIKTPEK